MVRDASAALEPAAAEAAELLALLAGYDVEAPARVLATVMVLQAHEGLSDTAPSLRFCAQAGVSR